MGYIKIVGNKVWKCANRRVVDRRHEIWFWKNVYHSVLNSCYGMSFFNLHSCVLFVSIFIILTNADTLITIYFYFCRWNHLKKRETIKPINKTFDQITQVMEVVWACLTTVSTKNDDQYIWISMKVVVFFEIIVCENQTFCL